MSWWRLLFPRKPVFRYVRQDSRQCKHEIGHDWSCHCSYWCDQCRVIYECLLCGNKLVSYPKELRMVTDRAELRERMIAIGYAAEYLK